MAGGVIRGRVLGRVHRFSVGRSGRPVTARLDQALTHTTGSPPCPRSSSTSCPSPRSLTRRARPSPGPCPASVSPDSHRSAKAAASN
ncbi:hypothetical protein ACFFX0_14910 [Citricoccus parietis]|uniref:Uncharacterized protein n=1 Tax=Citricoccus parietis TaxID=592307 RepID=A0ABV5G0F2_9MICC